MISKSFFESLEEVAFDRGLAIDDVLKRVEIAMAGAAKDNGYSGEVKIDLEEGKSRVRFFEYLYVIDGEEIPVEERTKGQITLEQAEAYTKSPKVGQTIKNEVDFSKFSQRSAQKFKNMFISGLKELEREYAYRHFHSKIGEIVTATIISNQNDFIGFDLGKNTISYMPIAEGLPEETYEIGESKKVYIIKVDQTTKGPKVYLSRKNKEIVRRLFEMNIPEVKDGTVEIVNLSRDPGNRSKVGVLSKDPNVDPKGACVGNSGFRVKTINMALNGEKIDIFTWKEDPKELVAEALLPAETVKVFVDEKEKSALAIVEDDQFSLAIGRNGQNVRLAAYAIGWKIDIKTVSVAKTEGLL